MLKWHLQEYATQLIWLLKKNSTKTRVETAFERATSEGSELEETVAMMLEEENDITDPRLILTSGEGGNEQSGRILDNDLKQINISEVGLDLVGIIGGYWGGEYGLNDQVAMKRSDIIDQSKPLDDRGFLSTTTHSEYYQQICGSPKRKFYR